MPLNATIALCVFAIGTGAIAHRQNFRHLDRLTSTDNLLEDLSDNSIKNYHQEDNEMVYLHSRLNQLFELKS
jgi:hypothetical protein